MKRLAILLTMALLFCTFTGCQPSRGTPVLDSVGETTTPTQRTQAMEPTQTEATEPPQTKPRDPNKIYCSATIDEYFSDHEIIVIIDKSWFDKEYTADDFSEIGCVSIVDISEQEDYKSMLRYNYRSFRLTLQEASKQNVLDCIRLLELREDMYFVSVKYTLPPGNTLKEQLDIAIMRAYCKLHNIDYETKMPGIKVRYFGQYGDVYAVYFDGMAHTAAMRDVIVYGYKFVFNSGQKMYIYRDGELCALDDVEMNGFISEDMVARIHKDFGLNNNHSTM